MDKYIKDGKVAVLYSPDFGAGWYSWYRKKEMLFDVELVEAVLNNEDYKTIIERKYPEAISDIRLEVEWVSEGSSIRIKEYDGSESVRITDNDNYIEV